MDPSILKDPPPIQALSPNTPFAQQLKPRPIVKEVQWIGGAGRKQFASFVHVIYLVSLAAKAGFLFIRGLCRR
jgi:hypothetical protein